METAELSRPGPFFRCREDHGVPVRLFRESDILCLPTTEELAFEREDGENPKDKDTMDVHGFLRWCFVNQDEHSGIRARLTTHRLLWQDASCGGSGWLALRLDDVAMIDATGGWFRKRRCQLRLKPVYSVAIRCSEAAYTDELYRQLQAAVMASKWREGSYQEASLGGLNRILGQRENRQQAVGETLEVALTDLESLRQHAAQTVAAARQVVAAHGTADTGEVTGVQRILEDFGLLGPDGAVVAKGGLFKKDIEADVESVCKAALEQRGGLGMLLAHDVFCLVNRARGTALVSPEEVMAALRHCSAPGGSLRLRTLGSTGTFAASLARTHDGDTDRQLVRLAEVGPLSAFRLATELGLTVAEAQYILRDAEARAAVVRDDAPEGVFYYPNFFFRC